MFLNAAGQFGIPAVIGIPMRYDVITTRIWVGLGYFPPKYTEAAAFSVVLLAISIVLVAIQHRLLARRSFVTVSGRNYKPGLVQLGSMRYVALAVCIGYFLLSIVLPYSALIFTSFQPYLSFAFDPGSWTLRQYADVLFHNSQTVRATKNSLVLATLGATLTIGFSLVISYVVLRTQARATAARLSLDPSGSGAGGRVRGCAAVGLCFPSHSDLRHDLDAARRLYRALHSVRRAGDQRRAHAAQPRARGEFAHSRRIGIGTLRRVVVPLMKPALTVGWILLFVEFIRSLSLSILLYSNDSVVMPVVIYDLYETGAYPALAAFSVLQTALIFAAIYGAKKLARLDNFMQLR